MSYSYRYGKEKAELCSLCTFSGTGFVDNGDEDNVNSQRDKLTR